MFSFLPSKKFFLIHNTNLWMFLDWNAYSDSNMLRLISVNGDPWNGPIFGFSFLNSRYFYKIIKLELQNKITAIKTNILQYCEARKKKCSMVTIV